MIISKIQIKAPAEKIWQALTDKTQMKEWYFDIPDFELKEGATFNFYEPGGKNEFHHRCVIKEIEPGKTFSHTWTHPDHSKGESRVTWLLNENNGITEVTLQHEGVENFADGGAAFAPENYQMGWDGFMSILKNYSYGIRKHTYEIRINATAEKVWDVLWSKESYPKWTEAFCAGSYYTGEMKPGNRIHFLAPDHGGMYSDVIFFTPYKNALFQHIGEIKNGVELPLDEQTEKWTGAFENYILSEEEGMTTLIAEVDLVPDHVSYFDEAFPKGLQKVKALSEMD